ncbi:hypothetical protein ACFE04_024439 [Oxalis oulophora]
MAEYICVFNKDTLLIKSQKKNPFFRRMIVFLFTMVCGFTMFSLCLKQMTPQTGVRIREIQVINKLPTHTYNGNALIESKIPFMHYPKPLTFSRNECEHNPVRFFAILSMQRSGSGWFETLLNSHMNVSSNGEIFSVLDRRRNLSSIINTLDKVYNMDIYTSASKNECSAAVGFKWMLNQGVIAHHKEIVEYFNRRGVSVIFLFRRNILRRMVSVLANSYDRYAKLLNGTHKAHVHSDKEAFMLSSYKTIINSTLLLKDLQDVEGTVKMTLKHFNSTRHIILYYEDLIKNSTKLKDVQAFLSLPRMKLTSRQARTTDKATYLHTRGMPVNTDLEPNINALLRFIFCNKLKQIVSGHLGVEKKGSSSNFILFRAMPWPSFSIECGFRTAL